MDIHLTTNGTLFHKKNKINDLFDSGIDKLIFQLMLRMIKVLRNL